MTRTEGYKPSKCIKQTQERRIIFNGKNSKTKPNQTSPEGRKDNGKDYCSCKMAPQKFNFDDGGWKSKSALSKK